MPNLDNRVPAVLLCIDRNPFHHGTLGAVRSLGRAGVEVHLVADSAGSPVRRSRFVSETHPPPPLGSSAADIAAVLRRVAARVSRPAVLVPMDDASALAVSRLGEELATGYLLPRQSGTLAERVADKAELATVCESLGIPHPVTLIPQSPAQAGAAAWQLGLPLVAKWSRPWLIPAGRGLRSTVVVRSAKEAQALYLRTAEAGSLLLLQAFLPPGPDRDWFFHGYVDRSGATHGGGAGRKHSARPRGAGLTAVGRWTPDPQLQALVERLTDALGYRGIFDLDFRRDATTDRYHLLDFNPAPAPSSGSSRTGRAWTSYAPCTWIRPTDRCPNRHPCRAVRSWWRTTRRSTRCVPGPQGSNWPGTRWTTAPPVGRCGVCWPATCPCAWRSASAACRVRRSSRRRRPMRWKRPRCGRDGRCGRDD